MEDRSESEGTTLCKACGLCCTGHLFAYAKLKPSELGPAEAMGLDVDRSHPSRWGFSQPCPLWKGACTIYASPNYPRVCRAYKCKLLKEVLAEATALSEALRVVGQAKGLIAEMEAILPVSANPNFRERLVEHVEHPNETATREVSYQDFRLKADALLLFYEQYFGVTGLIE